VVGLAHRDPSCGHEQAAIDCTGTLVAPRVVITAAHCLAFDPPNVDEVFFGASFSDGGVSIPVIGGRTDPDYDATTHAHDVAALILASDAPAGTVPVPLRRAALPDLTGATVRMVGYGITSVSATDVGVRMTGNGQISAVGADDLSIAPAPAMSCDGDSGGPVLADTGAGEELVGVTSYGDAACATLAVAIRVDRELAFIQAILDEAATPVDRPPFDPSAPLCATTCESDTDCSADTVCFGAAHPKHCVYRGLQPGQFGALCTPDATAICVTMPDGSCRSYLACDDLPPPADSGCSTGSGGSSLLSVLAVAWLMSRRARRRATRSPRRTASRSRAAWPRRSSRRRRSASHRPPRTTGRRSRSSCRRHA